jgi:hypothetical protein
MNFLDVEEIVSAHIDMITLTNAALSQGRERAAKFLTVQAVLSNHLLNLEQARAKASTMVEASYAQSIFKASGKNVTENKITASADPDYTSNREGLEELDAEINWTKTHMKIFENAHILYRNITRE